jgi:cation/acetate symporter
MAGAGGLVNLLLGVKGSAGQNLTIMVVGVLMIIYVLVGGMKGTTWVQIIKACLLIVGAALMTVWVLGKVGFDLSGLLGDAAARAPAGEAVLSPGIKYGTSTLTKIDFISLALALVLGTAGLPHVLMRFYTVPSSKEARRSVVTAIWLIGIFYLFTLVLGFGAMYLVGAERITAAPGKANSAAPLLAYELGGTLLLGVIAAVARDHPRRRRRPDDHRERLVRARHLQHSVIKKGTGDVDAEVRVARITAVVIGLVAIVGGIFAKDQNVAFLVALAFAVAASANLPTILYSLFWKGFTTRGALWSIYGGLISAVGLIIFSPVVSGKVDPKTGASLSMITDKSVDFSWFPLDNPWPDLDPN